MTIISPKRTARLNDGFELAHICGCRYIELGNAEKEFVSISFRKCQASSFPILLIVTLGGYRTKV